MPNLYAYDYIYQIDIEQNLENKSGKMTSNLVVLPLEQSMTSRGNKNISYQFSMKSENIKKAFKYVNPITYHFIAT